ncbi:MAG: hypothetical protein WKF74_12435 [Pyrinomonadaceae bacterium]
MTASSASACEEVTTGQALALEHCLPVGQGALIALTYSYRKATRNDSYFLRVGITCSNREFTTFTVARKDF